MERKSKESPVLGRDSSIYITADLGSYGIELGRYDLLAALGEVLFSAIQNPVIVVAILVSVWNAITDPTTKGISDSAQALTYNKPKSDE